jgi:hypothetical protein
LNNPDGYPYQIQDTVFEKNDESVMERFSFSSECSPYTPFSAAESSEL